MPEGPEVRCVTRAIEGAIGFTTNKLEIIEKPGFQHRYVRKGITGHDLFKAEPEWRITNLYSKGKLIRFNFQTPNGDKRLCALNTLGMSGTWQRNSKDHKHSRLNLEFTNGENLTFIDQRSFGTFKFTTPKKADSRLKKIGWDLLDAPMPDKDWLLLKERISVRNRELGELLMEQRLFSGIGNIYKAEILYQCKIKPCSLPSNLTNEKWLEINHVAHEILYRAYEKRGSSVQTYKANNQKGSFQKELKIYRKKQCSLGHLTTRIVQNKRTTWYCETCQSI